MGILKASTTSILLKVSNLLFTITVSVILARILGTESYGQYVYLFAFIQIMIVVAQFGMQNLSVREVSISDKSGNLNLYTGFNIFGLTSVLCVSIMISVLMHLFLRYFNEDLYDEVREFYLYFFFIILLISLLNVQGGVLRGLKYVILGQLFDRFIRPSLFIIGITVTYYLFVEYEWINVKNIFLIQTITISLAFLISSYFFYTKALKGKLIAKPIFKSKDWLQSALFFTLIGGVQVINSQTDIIMLGLYLEMDDVGIYKVGAQGALLVSFGLQAINMVFAPYISRAHVSGNKMNLQGLMYLISLVSIILALPVVIIFFLFGTEILTLVFGPSFYAGYYVLIILSVSQFINAYFGGVVLILNMTGREGVVMRGLSLTALLNILLNYFFIPKFGINGAAIATAISMVTWNVLLAITVQRKLGIRTYVLKINDLKLIKLKSYES